MRPFIPLLALLLPACFSDSLGVTMTIDATGTSSAGTSSGTGTSGVTVGDATTTTTGDATTTGPEPTTSTATSSTATSSTATSSTSEATASTTDASTTDASTTTDTTGAPNPDALKEACLQICDVLAACGFPGDTCMMTCLAPPDGKSPQCQEAYVLYYQCLAKTNCVGIFGAFMDKPPEACAPEAAPLPLLCGG